MTLLRNLLNKIFKKFEFCDLHGNKYYTKVINGQQKRFIIYKNSFDIKNIHPKYYAWLHHLIDSIEEIKYKTNILHNNKPTKVDIIKQKAYYSSWIPK